MTDPTTRTEGAPHDRLTRICDAMARGEHRTVCGLSEIVRQAGQMNPSGKRRYLPVQILQSLTEMKA